MLRDVSAGQSYTITVDGTPVADLIPHRHHPQDCGPPDRGARGLRRTVTRHPRLGERIGRGGGRLAVRPV
ncbi:hypothetical protein [Nocardia xishanensis]|uniref:Uncharacterized protein n=1 Tax=Nocardia xishanensis TaxID=238964 RepID=A0ABW7WYH6_9NOCA